MIRQYPWRKNARNWKKRRRESGMPRRPSQIWSRPLRSKRIRTLSFRQIRLRVMIPRLPVRRLQILRKTVRLRVRRQGRTVLTASLRLPLLGKANSSNSSSQIGSSGPSSGTVSSPVAGPGSSAAVVSATRTAIVAYAKQFLGNPYVYGGTSLTNGADCSGFTQSVFAHFGITTGRSSRDQAAKGKEISMSAIQPGDLLFYASGSYINHVAIYIGDGQIIHSSNPTTGITITKYNYRTPCKAVTFLD